jgi:RimJ/RimL family protein N-acetyltransferase
VFSGNDRAKAFYARQGFTQAGVRRFQVGANAYDDLVLARPI